MTLSPEEMQTLIQQQAELIARLTAKQDAEDSAEQQAAEAEFRQLATAQPMIERPCPFCQLVHDPSPNAQLICRCLYCGTVGPISGSTTDPRLGTGPVCQRCLGPVSGRDYLKQAESEAFGRPKTTLPWESAQ